MGKTQSFLKIAGLRVYGVYIQFTWTDVYTLRNFIVSCFSQDWIGWMDAKKLSLGLYTEIRSDAQPSVGDSGIKFEGMTVGPFCGL